MSLEWEEDALGEENHKVPKVDPDEYCNAKKSVTIHYGRYSESTRHIDPDLLEKIKEKNDVEGMKGKEENRTYFAGYCQAEAGKGTDHFGEGQCQHHGGATVGSDKGAPAHNQNGQTSAMSVDPHHYTENLPPEEEQWIERVTAELLDRVRRIHGREPDFVDRTLSRLVTIELHIVFNATDYTKDQLVQVILHDNTSHEEPGALVEEVRRYSNSIFSNLKDLGVMEDPESKKADSLNQWRDFVEGEGEGESGDIVEIEAEEIEDS